MHRSSSEQKWQDGTRSPCLWPHVTLAPWLTKATILQLIFQGISRPPSENRLPGLVCECEGKRWAGATFSVHVSHLRRESCCRHKQRRSGNHTDLAPHLVMHPLSHSHCALGWYPRLQWHIADTACTSFRLVFLRNSLGLAHANFFQLVSGARDEPLCPR